VCVCVCVVPVSDIYEDVVQQNFPETTVADVRSVIRQKCSNSVKALKYYRIKAAVQPPAADCDQ